MKYQITPVEISDLVPFSSSLNTSFSSKASKAAFSGISKNGLWMWIVCDTAINIYHTENSEWIGGYCFAESLKDSSVQITAAVEFCSSHINFPCLLISVNQEDECLICLFDINVSKVVRAVLVPDRVQSLEVICGNGGACMETHHLFLQIRYMFGIVAVGTCTGHLYFLDLCLDEDFASDENLPNITWVLKKYELQPELREMAISKQQHIFMLLNDQSTRNDCFEFESRSSSLGHFPQGKVHITALKYIQNTVTLAVGFNFGGIQLWNLQDLCLLYTVANQPQEQPIIAFEFQEPENDPRHFCYLWIIRGHTANERPEDFCTATMYSLVYRQKNYEESFGTVYTDLRNCVKRFEYRLTSDPYSSAQSSFAAGSCLLSCQIVSQTDENHYLEASSPNDSDSVAENMSLCFISWLVWSSSENYPSSYHLAVFDLNQWYRAQMPASNLRCDPSDLNPYFAHFFLEEVAQIFDLEPVLGLYGIPHSIKKFKFISPSEEFFYPSSLDFQAILFSTNGICKTTFLGLQKRLLYEMADLAPNVLVNPKELYSDLIRSGLLSDIHGTSDRIPLIDQREALLQLALEYHMPFFFMKCLKEWRYADSIQEGCTSRALVNWAWKKVITIKTNIDRLNIPLFNCSGCDIDKASLKCLYGYRRQLELIDTLLTGYQEFAAPRTEQGILELKCRKDVVFSINMYLQVLLWLRSVHVLPEVCEGEETDKNVLYPVNALLKSYHLRRSQLQKIHYSIGPTDILLIDGLVKEAFRENTWQEKNGNGIYPPPSIYAALSCYLLDDVHLELKHSLMYYILLDICNGPSNLESPFIRELKKFPVVFEMCPSVSKLVEAFWYLDQFNFEVAIKELLHPSVKSTDILPWQHHRVIKSFLYQKEAQKALKYINHMNPPENTIEDMKLHLSVLLSRGSITQAFDYQRSKSEGFKKDLLHHLFLGCQDTHRLKDLMYLPLNAAESSALVKFLSENDDPRSQEALVMYYLLRCNFFEAALVNDRLTASISSKSGPTYKRTAGREALVEGLLASIPKTEKNLMEEINRFPSYPVNKGENLKPLSLSVKNSPLQQITYSEILNSLLSEASSISCAPYLSPKTPFRSGNKFSFDDIPFLRPPLTPECKRTPPETTYSTPVANKRLLTSPSSEFSSPTKKSRLLDNVPFKTSSLIKKRVPKHLAGDVASLLQSPPIHRRGSKLFKEELVRNSPVTAPQGILKKKAEPPKYPASDSYTARTPSVLSDAGENSEGEEVDENMAIEEDQNDIPGRQIRFSVPSKDSFNASISMDTDAVEVNEESFSEIQKEATDFIKRLNELKPIPSLEPLNSESKEFINVTCRRTLTREPLKAFSEKKSSDSASSKQSLEHFAEPAPTENTSSGLSASEPKVIPESEFVNISDSDSCSASDRAAVDSVTCDSVKPENWNTGVLSTASHLSFGPSSAGDCFKGSGYPSSSSAQGTESMLNVSGSSGNSSYNSASERSFVITPRKPLRDNLSTSNSDVSVLSAVQKDKEVTLLGSKGGVSDEEDNDVSIIGEVSVPPSKEAESSKNVTGECSSHFYSFYQEKLVGETCGQFNVSEVRISEAENDAVASEDVRCIVEIPEGSQNSNSEDKYSGDTFHSDLSVECIEDAVEEAITTLEEKVETNIIANEAQEVIKAIEKQIDQAFEPPLKDVSDSMKRDHEFPITFSEDTSEAELPEAQDHIIHEEDQKTASGNIPNFLDILQGKSEPPTSGSSVPSVSTYIPLKERIKSSQTCDSEYIKDEEDDIYPSLLIKEQMEHQMLDEVFESKEKYVLQEHPKVVESAKKSEVPPDLSNISDMETGTPVIENTLNISDNVSGISFSPPTPTEVSKERFLKRCEFLSEHSNEYEDKKLMKETMELLKDNETEMEFDYKPDRKSRMTRTYVFERKSKIEPVTDAKSSDVETKNSKTSEASTTSKGFLETWNSETYEQFLHAIQKGDSAEDGKKKTLESSPNAQTEQSSLSLFEESTLSVQSASGVKGRSKKQASSKKDTSVDSRRKSTMKKAKDKGRIKKKMEFSFAEPHSPAGPEILEALSTPHEYPVGTFMFSPPLTRGRLRQKRNDETFGSSFTSVASDASFVQSKKPPIDPILEEIMTESAPESKQLTESSAKTKAKSTPRKKSTANKLTRAEISRSKIASSSTSQIIEEEKDSSPGTPSKHKMVLRQTKSKPKSTQLF